MMFPMSIVLCPVVFGAVLPRSTNRIVKTCYSPCINITVHASEVRDVFVTSCRLNSVFVIGNMSSVRIHPLDQKNGQCGKSYIFQFQLSYLAHIPYNEPHPIPFFFWTSSTEVIKFASICFFHVGIEMITSKLIFYRSLKKVHITANRRSIFKLRSGST